MKPASYELDAQRDVELKQFRTASLVVWIRRPSRSHNNWWLCYYSTDAEQARAWDCAIETIGKERGLKPFHQGVWPHDHTVRHPGCDEMVPSDCPGVAQAWEMWLGCSVWSREFPDASLEDIRACGDEALKRILDAVEKISEKARKWATFLL